MYQLSKCRFYAWFRNCSYSLLIIILSACGGGGGSSGGNGNSGVTDWITRNQGLVNSITSVTWNGSKYLAITDHGETIQSTDGIHWDLNNTGSGAGHFDLTWGNGLFVSTTGFAGIITSADGKTWTTRNSCALCLDDLNAVSWSGSQFAAVGEGGRIYTSDNGTTWTQQASNATTDDTFWDVASSSTTQVAVGSTFDTVTPLVRYSTNGTDWNTPTFDVTPVTKSFNKAYWDGSQFVIENYNDIYTSTDGSSWTQTAPGVYLSASGFAWDGSQYIAVTNIGVESSPDLVNWTTELTYINHAPSGVLFNSSLGQYLIYGENDWSFDSGWVATSTDASTWHLRIASDTKADIIWDGTQFIALDVSGRLHISTNGVSWDSTEGLTMDYSSEVYGGIAYSSSLGIYVGASSDKIMSSPDAHTWTSRYTDTFLTAQSVIWTGSEFIMVGWNGRYLNSTDGMAWNYKSVSGTITATPHLEDVSWSSSLGLFVVVTANSASSIYTSTDETSWDELGAAAPDGLYGIIWTGTRFIAVGKSGTIVTSLDGTIWNDRSLAITQTFYDVKMISGTIYAVGSQGVVYVSTDDGINWIKQTTDTSNKLLAIAGTSTRQVAVGEVGTVISH